MVHAICVAVSILVLVGIISSAMYMINCPSGGIRLKFKTFRSIYNINPNRWDLHDGYVRFIKEPYAWGTSYKFGFIDYFRYKYWKYRLDKQKSRKYETEQILELVSTARQDLVKFEQLIQYDTEKALNNIWSDKKEGVK